MKSGVGGIGGAAASQKLIHAEKVLKDSQTLATYEIKENDFMVCMVTKVGLRQMCGVSVAKLKLI